MESLSKIVADPVRIDIAGGREEIKPIKTRELPRLFKAIKPVLGDLQALFKSLSSLSESAVTTAITRYLMDGSDQLAECIIAATAIAARKDREWVDGLDLDELVFLIGKLVEVNGSFLAHQVLPRFADAMETMAATFAGPEPSTPLSGPVTD